MFLIVSGMPAMASPQTTAVSAEHQNGGMPPWLAEAGAIPMTDAEMAEVQGEGLIDDVFGTLIALSISSNVSATAFLAAGWKVVQYYGWSWNLAKGGVEALGWEIGRTMALNDGYPDIGAFYAPTNVAQFLPWYIQAGTNIVKNNM